jgi:hypothetical protein
LQGEQGVASLDEGGVEEEETHPGSDSDEEEERKDPVLLVQLYQL